VKAAKLTKSARGFWFADGETISPWARDAVFSAAESGIIKGYQDNTMRPLASASRAEAATVVASALKCRKDVQ